MSGSQRPSMRHRAASSGRSPGADTLACLSLWASGTESERGRGSGNPAGAGARAPYGGAIRGSVGVESDTDGDDIARAPSRATTSATGGIEAGDRW